MVADIQTLMIAKGHVVDGRYTYLSDDDVEESDDEQTMFKLFLRKPLMYANDNKAPLADEHMVKSIFINSGHDLNHLYREVGTLLGLNSDAFYLTMNGDKIPKTK